MRQFRFLFQMAVVVAVAVTGWRFAFGLSRTTIETYCPFGGVEAALSLVTQRQFTCATGERNLALFIALVGLTLLARKAFCGWVCPLGSLSEWAFRFARRKRWSLHPGPRLDRWLKWLRVPVLATIVFFTYKTGELVFRGYDPYYILFSFHGHDVQAWSYLVLGVVALGIVAIPMAWCRYLCPLGLVLQPFSFLGRLRIARNPATCTSCFACDQACPYSLRISDTDQVRDGDCTLCLECMADCAAKESLELRLEPFKR